MYNNIYHRERQQLSREKKHGLCQSPTPSEALGSTLASGDHLGKGMSTPAWKTKGPRVPLYIPYHYSFHHVETHSKLNTHLQINLQLYIQYNKGVQTRRDISAVVESTFQLLSRARQHCGLIEWSWQDGIQLILDLAPL